MNAKALIEAEDPKQALRQNFGRNLTATINDLDLDWVISGNPEHCPNHFTAAWNWPWQRENPIKGSPIGTHPTDPMFAVNDLRCRTERESDVLIKTVLYDKDVSEILAWGRQAMASGDYSEFRPYRPESRALAAHMLGETYGFPDYGEQDKPEHWEGGEPEPNPYPPGIVATRGSEQVELRFERGGYYFTKRWADDYTGRPREGKGLGFHRVGSSHDAQEFIRSETERWQAGGWSVKPL